MKTKKGHVHQWGPWLHPDEGRVDYWRLHTYAFCINGFCPMGRYKNGRRFVARPERK